MLTSVVLAAGKGTRMKSKLPKVLHKVVGKTMLEHVLDVLNDLESKKNNVVIGHGRDLVKETIKGYAIDYVVQEKQLGTGHAVKMCQKNIPNKGDVIILYGDTPLLTSETIQEFIAYHQNSKNFASVLSSMVDNPYGYGRIVKDENGKLIKIVEEKDATVEEKKINEINSGIYCVKAKALKDALELLNPNNAQGEYYLTDIIEILHQKNRPLGSFVIDDPQEIIGVNNRKQLSKVEKIYRNRIIEKHMMNGVTFVNPESITVEKDVKIGMDTEILQGAYIAKNTTIGEDCVIGPNGRIENSVIDDRVEVRDSTIIDSKVGSDTCIGPYAYLRPNSTIGQQVKIGDFVEVKNSTVGDHTKISHLSYIGDGVVGEHVNIGCGVVFVNYDGKDKHQTIVKDHSFVGCNVNLVAPVVVEEHSYIAAGSTITDDVPKESLSIARQRQTNKLNWVKKRKL